MLRLLCTSSRMTVRMTKKSQEGRRKRKIGKIGTSKLRIMSWPLTMLRKWRERKEKEERGDQGPQEKKKVDKDTRNRMMDKELRCRNCRYVFFSAS